MSFETFLEITLMFSHFLKALVSREHKTQILTKRLEETNLYLQTFLQGTTGSIYVGHQYNRYIFIRFHKMRLKNREG